MVREYQNLTKGKKTWNLWQGTDFEWANRITQVTLVYSQGAPAIRGRGGNYHSSEGQSPTGCDSDPEKKHNPVAAHNFNTPRSAERSCRPN